MPFAVLLKVVDSGRLLNSMLSLLEIALSASLAFSPRDAVTSCRYGRCNMIPTIDVLILEGGSVANVRKKD
jgi:hypothetical protein